jgi:hypothetical protein
MYFAKYVEKFTYIGAAHIFTDALVSIPVLSDATNTFECGLHISSSPAINSVPNNSVGIRYSHGINSGNFQGFTKDNAGAESTADLGINVTAGTIYKLRIELDKSNSEVRFFVNGSYAGRVTSNMPTANPVGVRCFMLKSAGTTATNFNVSSMSAGAIYP